MKDVQLLYPIFLLCLDYITEDYWIEIFRNLAYGKTPNKSIIITDKVIYSKQKNKDFYYEYTNDISDINILYKKIKELFYTRYNIESSVQKKINYVSSLNDEQTEYKSWISIKKKSVRYQLVEKFVYEKEQEYNLSFDESKQLISLIYVGLTFRTITSNDIIFSNGKIVDIKNIKFINNKFVFIEDDTQNIKIEDKHSKNIEQKIISINWNKYIQNIEKIIYDIHNNIRIK